MAAGHRIYSFDWDAFTDLTTNPQSEIHGALAQALEDEQMRKKLRLPGKLPKTSGELTPFIRDLFLQPEWFAGRPKTEVKLRHELLFAMFFSEQLQPLGLSLAPAWREFYECCCFNVASVLAGRMALNFEMIQRSKAAYFKIVPDAKPRGNEFWWFGNRPYRHDAWQASDDEWIEYEEEYDCQTHSIHSPHQVNSLSGELAGLSKACEQIECEELQESLAEYAHCIEGVKQKKAGMFVENDT